MLGVLVMHGRHLDVDPHLILLAIALLALGIGALCLVCLLSWIFDRNA
jgi:hypothetical protein